MRFSHWGPCARRLLLRTPQPVHRPPPLSCCRIIFNVLDHAAAGAGGRRLQKKPGVAEQGQPNITLPQTSHDAPQIPSVLGANGGCQVRCGVAAGSGAYTPTPNPSTSCSTLSSCFRHKGPGGAPVVVFVPHTTANSQPREQSFLCSCPCPTHGAPRPWRPGEPGRGLCSSWLVPADVKSTFTCFHVQGRARAAGCGRESSGFWGRWWKPSSLLKRFRLPPPPCSQMTLAVPQSRLRSTVRRSFHTPSAGAVKTTGSGAAVATKQRGNLKGGVPAHLRLQRVRCTHVVERWFWCRRRAKRERQRLWKWWWRQLFLGSKPRPQRLRWSIRQWFARALLRQEVTTLVAQGVQHTVNVGVSRARKWFRAHTNSFTDTAPPTGRLST